MKNYNNIMEGVFFRCDCCGKGYTFSQSFLSVSKGQTYTPHGGKQQIADCDLCRDCAGQAAKFDPEQIADLEREIEQIDKETRKEQIKETRKGV